MDQEAGSLAYTVAEAVELFTFALIWLQPIFWMVAYEKPIKILDRHPKAFGIALAIAIVAANVAYWAAGSPPRYALLPSASLYALLGFHLSKHLTDRSWKFSKALPAAAVATFTASYFWEAPYLVRNAFITGLEGDWAWHLVGLLYFNWVRLKVGHNKHAWLIIPLGLAVSSAYIYFWPIPPHVVGPEIWNSAYYMSNRLVCILIYYASLRTDLR